MAIGTQYSVAESGWVRYEVESPNVSMSNDTWTADTTASNSQGQAFYTPSKAASYTFKFVGTSFRIIGRLWDTSYHTNNQVYVDGSLHGSFTLIGARTYSAIVYEANNLEAKKEHTVEVRSGDNSAYFWADAVDILKPINRFIVKNEATNQHYSLSEKTIIHMPDISDKNMILYGVPQDKEIQLDTPFNKKTYILDSYKVLGVGRVFEKEIDINKITQGLIIL